MNVLISTLKEELGTVQKLEQKYLKKIKESSPGSFIIRTVGSKKYGYLTRRQKGRVIQDYLGPVDEITIQHYRDSMKQKKETKRKLKSVRDQIKILKKALRGKAT